MGRRPGRGSSRGVVVSVMSRGSGLLTVRRTSLGAGGGKVRTRPSVLGVAGRSGMSPGAGGAVGRIGRLGRRRALTPG
jgi:hypothetical protein